MPIENVTPNRAYQLPNAANDLVDDVARLIVAVTGIDLDVATILAALLTKSDVGHEHVIGDITGLGAALAALQALDQKGQANGYAALGSDGKVPAAQLPAALFGAMSYQGTWNASTNSPVIPAANATNKGHYYKVSVAGTTTISGVNDWEVGDWVVSNGVGWDKIDNTDQVMSVAGLRGVITAVALQAALGLKQAAYHDVGTTPGTVADGVAALQYKGAIGASEDLDTYTTPGIYVQNQISGASGGTNYPVANAGMLEVLDGGGATNVRTVQRYTEYSQPPIVWQRMRRNGGNWSAWLNLSEWMAETVSQVEAEAGTATDRRAWTAERVKQAIEAIAPAVVPPSPVGLYTGSNQHETNFPIGHHVLVSSGTFPHNNSSAPLYVSNASPIRTYTWASGSGAYSIAGTWAARGAFTTSVQLAQRVA